jgi:hypothetical protein
MHVWRKVVDQIYEERQEIEPGLRQNERLTENART